MSDEDAGKLNITAPRVLAKLSRPRLHRTVARERLFALIDSRKQHPIIWMAGPAGAGKTSLVSSYCSTRKLFTVWLQLDHAESDAASFFHYLRLASEAHSVTLRNASLPNLTPDYGLDSETYARNFARVMFSGLPGDSVLVLDNYQTLNPASAVHRLVVCMLEEIPASINVIVASRTPAPPDFTRLAASQALAVLSWDDLAFDLNETKSLLELWGKFEDTEVRRLHEQSSGWAAGLVLAAAHGRRNGLALSEGTEDSEAVFDYFLKEVFETLPHTTQDVLLRASYLPYVSSAQGVELTGNSEAEDVLEAAYQAQLFVDRSTGPHQAYRFHALFKRFLRDQARKVWSAPALASHLVAAARMLEQDGQPEEAATLLIEAQAWSELVKLVCENAPVLLKQGRNALVSLWVESIPSAISQTVPWLQFWAGAACMLFDPARSRIHLKQAFALFKRDGDATGQIASCALVLQSYLAEQGDFSPVDEWLPELSRLLDNDQLVLPPPLQALLIVGAAAIFARDPTHALVTEMLTRAGRFITVSTDVDDNVMVGWFGVNVNLIRGNVREALWIDTHVIDKLDPNRVAPASRIIRAGWAAMIAVFNADFAEVFRQVDAGLQLAQDTGIHVWDFSLFSSGGYAAHDAGDLARLQAYIALRGRGRNAERGLDVGLTTQLKAIAALLAGDAAAAVRQADLLMEQVEQCGARGYCAMGRATLAQALVQSGDQLRAGRVMDQLEGDLKQVQYAYLRFLLPALRADSLLADGEVGSALVHVTDMMRIGREENLRNVPGLWHAKAMSRLCALALEHDIEGEYVRGLIAVRDLAPPSPHVLRLPWRLRVYTFGEFRLELDGATVAAAGKGPKKVLALLKAIIAYGGKSVAEQTLIDALWPDSEGDAGREALKITLLRLRRLLSIKDAVEVHEGRIGLKLSRCWVDALAFTELVRSADGADSGVSDEVLELYRGTFLREEVSDPWAVAPRERLRAKFIHVVAGRGVRMEALSQFEPAMNLYLRGLEADDLTEEFYQGLMRCYLAMGRPSEGISTYRRLRHVLSVTLNIAPSPESERLYERLRGIAS